MRFFQKTKGAISLFLVIILVPMMTLSGLYVDASRVNLGKAMAESAGDLALNTALTNYDTDLKELYGLMATAQNMDDLFGKLEDYYRTCITSSGVSAEDAETYVEQIMAQLGVVSESNDTADIMNMELVDFAVQKYPNANLANATVLKRQIVDFMKYRAPINTGLSFLSSLKSFTTLSKQTELVEKKQAYYEEQQGVMANLKSAWAEIAKYNGTNIVKDADYLSTIKSKLNNMKNGTEDGAYTGYSQLHEWMIMDLYHVSPYISYACQVNGSGTSFNVIWGGVNKDVKKYTRELPAVSDFQEVVIHFKSAVEHETATFSKLNMEKGDPYYDLQHLVQQRRNGEKVLDVYTNQMIEVHQWYLTLKGLYDNLEEYDNRILAKMQEQIDAEEDKTTAETELNTLKNSTNPNQTRISELETEIQNLETTIANLQTEIDGMPESADIKNESFTVEGETKTVQQWYDAMGSEYQIEMDNEFQEVGIVFSGISDHEKPIYDVHYTSTTSTIDAIANELKVYLDDLTNSSTYLETAIQYLEAAKTALDGTVADAKEEWSKVADDETIAGTSLAKQDQAEIDQLDTYLNSTNIGKLITRLTNVKTKVDEAIAQIKGYQYCDTFIGDIKTYNTLESAVENKLTKESLENVPQTKTELQAQANTWWSSCWKDGNLEVDWVNTSGTYPDLTRDKCSMYSYLYSHFAAIVTAEGETKAGKPAETSTDVAEESTDYGKDFYEDMKANASEEAKTKADETGSAQAGKDTASKNISSLSNTPTKLHQSELSAEDTPSGSKDVNTESAAGSASSSLGDLFSSDFLDALTKMATSLRDKLYVSDYAMSMFSYDTIENEYRIKKGMQKDAEIPAGTLLTLTKNDLSATNNYAYGAEVEYIIYGGTNSDNIDKAYGTIYGIRFGFNLIYAFATSEIRDSALAIATPISAATLGIIPVPLIQAAIIIALACCESAIDLADISDGYQIPLYKSKSSWVCSIGGLTKKAKDEAVKVIRERTEVWIDEGLDKLNDVLDMTDEELNNLINSEKEDIVDSVENVYTQLIEENANLAIQTLTTLVNDAIESTRCLELNETYEAKKEEAIDKAIDELKNWRDGISGDDIASTVKREAVNIIIAEDGKLVRELFTEMEKAAQSSKPGDVVTNVMNVTEEGMGKITELGGDIMTKIKEVRTLITYKIEGSCEKVKTFKDAGIKRVEDALASGAENLKENLNNAIDSCLTDICGPDGTGGDEGVGTAGLCSFAYSDYLRLFTLIGLITNEEKVVLRIGDVIQANLAQCTNKGSGYQLQNAATYIEVSADIQVKPIFLALPLFAEVENNPNTDASWYTIEYNGKAGY